MRQDYLKPLNNVRRCKISWLDRNTWYDITIFEEIAIIVLKEKNLVPQIKIKQIIPGFFFSKIEQQQKNGT